MAHVEVGRTAFAREIEAVLRERGRAREIKDIRDIIRRFRESVGRLKL
jgi:hypothetical protein